MLSVGQKRQIWMGASVFSVAAIALAGIMVLQPSPRAIMENARDQFKTLESGHAVLDIEMSMPEMSANSTLEIWAVAGDSEETPGQMRVEVLSMTTSEADKDLTGMILVSDGEQVWVFDPRENTVYTGTRAEFEAAQAEHDQIDRDSYGDLPLPDWAAALPAPPNSPEEAFDMVFEYFEVSRSGSTSVAGGNAHELRFLPIADKMPAQFALVGGLGYAYFDQASGLPVGGSWVGSSMGEARFTVQSFEVNIAIDPSVFTFDIPVGAEVVSIADLQPDPETLQRPNVESTPLELPFEAVLINTEEISGVTVQHYQLADGGRFSIAQGSADLAFPLPNADAQLVQMDDVTAMLYTNADDTRGLITWAVGDVGYWAGGDLTSAQLLEVVEALK